MARPAVVYGQLGTTLDAGRGPKRWERWRPTVGLCAQPDWQVHRLELLVPPRYRDVAAQVVADVQQISPETVVRQHTLDLDDPWDFESVYGALADFFAGCTFDPEREDTYVHITTGTHVSQISLFLLAESRRVPARLIQTGTGPDPVRGLLRIIDLDLSRYDRIAKRFAHERVLATSFLKDGIATRNAAFNALIERIEHVAVRSPDPVLLLGPTGAGKSRLAERMYALLRARRLVEGAFVALNCATVRGDGASSALFGHVKGAFTGAVSERAGLLRSGHGGVVFLDELDALGLDEQAMLLRALEEHRFLPVGSDREVDSKFRLIAGSNADLAAEAAAGRFREDLLARIDTWTFRLPALADRREDIAPNLDFEVARFADAAGRRVTMNHEARARFLLFAEDPSTPWSRNFRDLGAAVRRMGTLADGGRITTREVDEEVARLRSHWGAGAPDADAAVLAEVRGPGAEPLDPFEAVQLAYVVRTCRAHPTLAAAGRALFAVSRARRTSTNDGDRLRKYLAGYGLDFAAVTGRPRV